MAKKQSRNNNLHSAKSAKNDEFYTQLSDIEKELKHYHKHFKGKTVYCNCDDPFKSNFFKYFVLNFNELGLKKLIATHYTSPAEGSEKKPCKAVVSKVEGVTGDGGIDIAELFRSGDNILEELQGDGDFRSEESIELLKEADIVVSNPPFSLWRVYVAQLIGYEKQFLTLGSMNAITYKEIFPLLKDGEMRIGHNLQNLKFILPNGGLKSVNTRWYTNLDISKHHEDLILDQKYHPEKYQKYDNYDAINVDKVVEMPIDYDGVMGVPITFMDKYNPEQFEIVAQMANTKVDEHNAGYPFVNGKKKYTRILIRNRHPEKPEGENIAKV